MTAIDDSKLAQILNLVILGAVMLLIGISMLMSRQDEYSVTIKTSAGEDLPLSHASLDYIVAMVHAVNTSITSW